MSWAEGFDPELPGGFQDADFDQRDLEAAGAQLSIRVRHALKLKAAGRLEDAARMCPHLSGYGLRGDAARAENDPRAGEPGERCSDCGTVLDGPVWDETAAVLYPCETL